jgi:hypothetical protein
MICKNVAAEDDNAGAPPFPLSFDDDNDFTRSSAEDWMEGAK